MRESEKIFDTTFKKEVEPLLLEQIRILKSIIML